MAAPLSLGLVVGPVTPHAARCRTEEITAVAATRRTVSGGVLGVVHLHGSTTVRNSFGRQQPCSLHIDHGPVRLLAADGTALDVPRSSGDTTMAAGNHRSDIPLAAGDATWGFGWYGSYCGRRAAAVEFRLPGGGMARAPVHGPQPACSGGGGSILVDGVPGSPGEPVESAPPGYAQLRLSASVERGTNADHLAPIDLILSTTGSTAVPLDPCPSYGGNYYAHARSGGFGTDLQSGYLPCTQRTTAVRPGRPLHFTIPATIFDQVARPGSVVRLTVGIAGVPVVQLSVTVR